MILSQLKKHAATLKLQTLTVYYAARDSDTPVAVRCLAILVAAYALSPIDLIPDFIPVIGLLDDLIIIPLGLYIVIHFTPPHVMASARQQASQQADKPVSYAAAAVFIAIWIILLATFSKWLMNWYGIETASL